MQTNMYRKLQTTLIRQLRIVVPHARGYVNFQKTVLLYFSTNTLIIHQRITSAVLVPRILVSVMPPAINTYCYKNTYLYSPQYSSLTGISSWVLPAFWRSPTNRDPSKKGTCMAPESATIHSC
jgi:hypothetical protein